MRKITSVKEIMGDDYATDRVIICDTDEKKDKFIKLLISHVDSYHDSELIEVFPEIIGYIRKKKITLLDL